MTHENCHEQRYGRTLVGGDLVLALLSLAFMIEGLLIQTPKVWAAFGVTAAFTMMAYHQLVLGQAIYHRFRNGRSDLDRRKEGSL